MNAYFMFQIVSKIVRGVLGKKSGAGAGSKPPSRRTGADVYAGDKGYQGGLGDKAVDGQMPTAAVSSSSDDEKKKKKN